MGDRKLRTWRVSFTCRIAPVEESEGSQKYLERAMSEVDQEVTIEIRAYTHNAAYERFARALQGLVDGER